MKYLRLVRKMASADECNAFVDFLLTKTVQAHQQRVAPVHKKNKRSLVTIFNQC